MPLKQDYRFRKNIDNFILKTKDEKSLRVIKWVDDESQKYGVSFYDMFFYMMKRDLVERELATQAEPYESLRVNGYER